EVPFLFLIPYHCRLCSPALPCGCVLFVGWYVGMPCFVCVALWASCDVVIFYGQIKKDRQRGYWR
ncbi:hypothetical protein IJ556_06120, partial [bacterium]|nr:hypothetical protein [bacterium]